MSAALSETSTFPRLLRRNARIMAARPAIREKDLGIWQTWTWADVHREAEALAAGLAAMGLGRGDKLAIVGDNRPRLYWGMVAAQYLGAIPVPLYQDSVAEEMKFVLDHAEAKIALVEDQEQVDKILSVMDDLPTLTGLIYDNKRGLRHYTQPFLKQFDEVQAEGRARLAADPELLNREIEATKPEDIAIMLYTSGTTGQPKGVMLSYDNVIRTAINGAEFEKLTPDENVLAYLPMAWVGDNLFSFAQSLAVGFCVNCPESGATVMHDLREIGPTYFFAPPRIFENLLTTVMIRMEDAGTTKRWLFKAFMEVARRVGNPILDGKPVSFIDRIKYGLGQIFVYGPLKNTLGMSRVRVAYTAGEAIGPDIFNFYRSIGINLKQLYGSTEASVFITLQPDGEIKPDTVGRPAPQVEIKIADDGEVHFKSPGVFVAYYKNDQATAETKTSDGWVRTGDAGFFDPDGHLKIIDRAKDVGKLTDGTLFAPKYLENKLKFFPHIREAVAFGHGRAFATAFINIDLEAVGNWAERRGIAYASYQELAANPEVYALIKGQVEQVNRDLSAEDRVAGSQIKRFLILHKELDADDGELTRTRKVRRSFVMERYGPLVEALYSGADAGRIETQVKYEDGRTGMLKANLRIADADTYGAAAPMKQAS